MSKDSQRKHDAFLLTCDLLSLRVTGEAIMGWLGQILKSLCWCGSGDGGPDVLSPPTLEKRPKQMHWEANATALATSSSYVTEVGLRPRLSVITRCPFTHPLLLIWEVEFLEQGATT